MILESSQLSSLTEMGIPVWELRTRVIASPASWPVSAEFDEPLPAVDCLIVLAEQDNSDEAKRLLHAMLFSIGLTANKSAIVSPTQLSQLVTSPTAHKLLLAFGDELVPKALNSQKMARGQVYSASESALKIIINLSLTTLLNSPDKKALAWQDLQLVKAAYQQDGVS